MVKRNVVNQITTCLIKTVSSSFFVQRNGTKKVSRTNYSNGLNEIATKNPTRESWVFYGIN